MTHRHPALVRLDPFAKERGDAYEEALAAADASEVVEIMSEDRKIASTRGTMTEGGSDLSHGRYADFE